VIIEGFKSYREKTVLEPFHPNLNVIGKYAVLV
jgi:chromosome segregation ATPase